MIGITSPKNRKIGPFLRKIDSCFLIEMKFISKLFKKFRRQNESQENPRLRLFIIFKNSSFLIIKNPGILNFKNSKIGRLRAKVSKISKILSFRCLRKMFFHFFQGCSLIFLDLIQVILSNKMKKYGLPEPKTLIIHEMLSFRCLMP